MASEIDPKPGARTALALLLGINLFNYIDRQILAAVEPQIRETFFASNNPNAMAIDRDLGTAFLVTYMLSARRWAGLPTASRAGLSSGWPWCFGVWLAALPGWRRRSWRFSSRAFLLELAKAVTGPRRRLVLSDLFPLETRGRMTGAFFARPFLWAARSVTSWADSSMSIWAGGGHSISLPRPASLSALLLFFPTRPARDWCRSHEGAASRREDYMTLFQHALLRFQLYCTNRDDICASAVSDFGWRRI